MSSSVNPPTVNRQPSTVNRQPSTVNLSTSSLAGTVIVKPQLSSIEEKIREAGLNIPLGRAVIDAVLKLKDSESYKIYSLYTLLPKGQHGLTTTVSGENQFYPAQKFAKTVFENKKDYQYPSYIKTDQDKQAFAQNPEWFNQKVNQTSWAGWDDKIKNMAMQTVLRTDEGVDTALEENKLQAFINLQNPEFQEKIKARYGMTDETSLSTSSIRDADGKPTALLFKELVGNIALMKDPHTINTASLELLQKPTPEFAQYLVKCYQEKLTNDIIYPSEVVGKYLMAKNASSDIFANATDIQRGNDWDKVKINGVDYSKGLLRSVLAELTREMTKSVSEKLAIKGIPKERQYGLQEYVAYIMRYEYSDVDKIVQKYSTQIASILSICKNDPSMFERFGDIKEIQDGLFAQHLNQMIDTLNKDKTKVMTATDYIGLTEYAKYRFGHEPATIAQEYQVCQGELSALSDEDKSNLQDIKKDLAGKFKDNADYSLDQRGLINQQQQQQQQQQQIDSKRQLLNQYFGYVFTSVLSEDVFYPQDEATKSIFSVVPYGDEKIDIPKLLNDHLIAKAQGSNTVSDEDISNLSKATRALQAVLAILPDAQNSQHG